jgi:quercetin dioxygenase-like cupin family protein
MIVSSKQVKNPSWMPEFEITEHGNLRVTEMTFKAAGDYLPVHEHGPKTSPNHITIIAHGSFLVLPAETRTVHAGDMVDWQDGELHGFRALTNGAKLFNITK